MPGSSATLQLLFLQLNPTPNDDLEKVMDGCAVTQELLADDKNFPTGLLRQKRVLLLSSWQLKSTLLA